MGVELEQVLKRLRWAEVTRPDVFAAFMAYLTFGDGCIDSERLYEVSKLWLDHFGIDKQSFEFHLEWITDGDSCRKLSNHYYEKVREVLRSFIEERETIEAIVKR